MSKIIELSGTEIGIFWENKDNSMAADKLVPWTSAAMILTMQEKQVFAFYEKIFLLPTPSRFSEIAENLKKILLCLLE